MFDEEFGVDVTAIPGGGAAGGLGGALAALGATLMPGFELVADELDLYDHVATADLVITGEGRLDDTSFAGKVVGGVAEIGAHDGVPVAAIVGSADPATTVRWRRQVEIVSLADRFGEELALAEPKSCVERAAAELISAHRDG